MALTTKLENSSLTAAGILEEGVEVELEHQMARLPLQCTGVAAVVACCTGAIVWSVSSNSMHRELQQHRQQ
jgi:hypothetical protein